MSPLRSTASSAPRSSSTPSSAVDLAVTVDRRRQRAAIRRHASQAVPTSVLWRRLELLGDTEYLRWIHDANRGDLVGVVRDREAAALAALEAASADLSLCVLSRSGKPHPAAKITKVR